MLKKYLNLWSLAAFASAIYLLNPGFGIFEILPDNLPILGNIDEGFMAVLLIKALTELKVIKEEDIKNLMNMKKSQTKKD